VASARIVVADAKDDVLEARRLRLVGDDDKEPLYAIRIASRGRCQFRARIRQEYGGTRVSTGLHAIDIAVNHQNGIFVGSGAAPRQQKEHEGKGESECLHDNLLGLSAVLSRMEYNSVRFKQQGACPR
jgi:hypothetical protein